MRAYLDQKRRRNRENMATDKTTNASELVADHIVSKMEMEERIQKLTEELQD